MLMLSDRGLVGRNQTGGRQKCTVFMLLAVTAGVILTVY